MYSEKKYLSVSCSKNYLPLEICNVCSEKYTLSIFVCCEKNYLFFFLILSCFMLHHGCYRMSLACLGGGVLVVLVVEIDRCE